MMRIVAAKLQSVLQITASLGRGVVVVVVAIKE